MVEDGLDGEPVTWRLAVSVARAGLRERGRALVFGRAPARRLRRIGSVINRWWPGFIAASVLALFPVELKQPPPPGRAWQATAALDVLIAITALAGLVVLAGGLVAVPAFWRFVRASGWAAIRRRVAWAAGATAVAGGALAGFGLGVRSQTWARLNASWSFFLWEVATMLALMVALGLWRSAATATARQLDLSPTGRIAGARLGALTSTAASVMLATDVIVFAALQSSVLLLVVGVSGLAAAALRGRMAMRRAVARARRPRRAARRA
jgi:hypothetical protein